MERRAMRTKIKDRRGTVIAETEVDPSIGAITIGDRVFTPVQFMHLDGTTDWDRIGSEFSEVGILRLEGPPAIKLTVIRSEMTRTIREVLEQCGAFGQAIIDECERDE